MNLILNKTRTDPFTPATYVAGTTFTLIFPNDDGAATLTCSGQFNMWKPTATVSPVTDEVGVKWIDGGYNQYALIFGKNSGHVGIIFYYTTNSPSKFAGGSVEWVQVETEPYREKWNDSIDDLLMQTEDGPWLDTSDPYPILLAGVPNDSPNIGLVDPYTNAGASDSFEMTMMFYPPGGGHRVPLHIVDWSWQGTATYDGEWWTASGTGEPDNNSPTENYPHWNGILNNNNYIRQ